MSWTISSEGPRCPYCKHVNEFDYSDDPDGDWSCGSCDKVFRVETEWTPTFRSKPLPCQNGEPHDFRAPDVHSVDGKVPYICRHCELWEWRSK